MKKGDRQTQNVQGKNRLSEKKSKNQYKNMEVTWKRRQTNTKCAGEKQIKWKKVKISTRTWKSHEKGDRQTQNVQGKNRLSEKK